MKLYNLLPEKDKELIIEYIDRYGVGKEDFIGLETWLKHWDKDKRKLYKLLGNQFQVEFPVNFTKNDDIIEKEIDNLMYGNEKFAFIGTFQSFLKEGFDLTRNNKDEKNEKFGMSYYDFSNIRSLLLVKTIAENKIDFSLTIEKAGLKKKPRLQAGMKPIKALQAIVNAFPEYFLAEDFEQFRIEHSKILNDKLIRGTAVISIHPLDFLTMSDNNSKWTSCMSWVNDGCYHLGTVEMMNSNNVVCAYLKSKTPFCFATNGEGENLEWNNKRWRQLFYVTKEINVSGKSYPYYNEEITKTVLNKIAELAKENLGWNYKFSEEEYFDMKYIDSLEDIERQQIQLQEGTSTKKNILFHSNVMYNDMLNDHNFKYWCHRNKVNKTKIITYSGKASCLMCGGSAVDEAEYFDEYNERFNHPDKAICDCCYDASKCSWCGAFEGKSKIKYLKKGTINMKETKQLCSRCYKHVYKCPCCGDDFFAEYLRHTDIPIIRLCEDVYYEDFSMCNFSYFLPIYKNDFPSKEVIKEKGYSALPAYLCSDCLINKMQPNEDGSEPLFKKIKIKSKEYATIPIRQGVISSKVYTLNEVFSNTLLSSLLPMNLVKEEPSS